MDEVDRPPGVGWGAATRDGAGEQHGSEAAMPQPPSALLGCVQRNEPTASASPDAAASEAFPRWNSLRAQNKKKEERALEIKTEKETDVKGRRTTSPPGCDPAAGPAAGPR